MSAELFKPPRHPAMMRTGATVMQAEAVTAIAALRGSVRWDSPRNCMARPVYDHAIPIDVGALLYQLG
ncbi:hypothetical protein GCM10010981_16850 [Dyella nitratireducens]|uniref:Uncharacterized protein n=1 Tax=Dyella nitratireducens TaxID=1849580 RepID=A0ABQ1FTC7_9GAMM|nr:hypothetical protein GCM10010981_16850 [Dyella nitratireducens]GLQ43250.1 hypothetical protein GCM10007902_31000 [Dyella nitratireducens]